MKKTRPEDLCRAVSMSLENGREVSAGDVCERLRFERNGNQMVARNLCTRRNTYLTCTWSVIGGVVLVAFHSAEMEYFYA